MRRKDRIRRHTKLICYMLVQILLQNYNPVILMETHISWNGVVGVPIQSSGQQNSVQCSVYSAFNNRHCTSAALQKSRSRSAVLIYKLCSVQMRLFTARFGH